MDLLTSDRLTSDERLTQMMQSLGHPARMQIIRYLSRNPTCIADELVEGLCLAHEIVFQHLNVLCQAGWIFCALKGSTTYYSLRSDNISWFKEQIERRF